MPSPNSSVPRRARLLGLLATAALALSGVGACAAHGHEAGDAASGDHGTMDDAHLRRLVEYLYERVESPQREQIGELAHAAEPELEAFAQQAGQARAPRAALLLADRIDLDALERARREEMRIADARSRRVNELLVAIAQVLTPDQRTRLRGQMLP